jgi:A/G-specific adenine glycosylase
MHAVKAEDLLLWYRTCARSLPWRSDPRDPYHVLVSEFMLQQTQVDRVVPRFVSFVTRFPGLEALAEASEDEVLTEWSGLGYYRRARMLHRLAREVVKSSEGFPRSSRELW